MSGIRSPLWARSQLLFPSAALGGRKNEAVWGPRTMIRGWEARSRVPHDDFELHGFVAC